MKREIKTSKKTGNEELANLSKSWTQDEGEDK